MNTTAAVSVAKWLGPWGAVLALGAYSAYLDHQLSASHKEVAFLTEKSVTQQQSLVACHTSHKELEAAYQRALRRNQAPRYQKEYEACKEELKSTQKRFQDEFWASALMPSQSSAY